MLRLILKGRLLNTFRIVAQTSTKSMLELATDDHNIQGVSNQLQVLTSENINYT
jgi:hypothetical protein